jgi:hypothetical protein
MLGLEAYDYIKFYAALGESKADTFLCVETACRSTRRKSRCKKIK